MPDTTISTDTQTPTPAESTPTTDFNVKISPEQYKTLQSIADQQGMNPSDAIDQAIGIAKIVVDAERAEGQRVLIQKGKQLQELTLS